MANTRLEMKQTEEARQFVLVLYPTAHAHKCANQPTTHIFVGQNGQQKILGRGPTANKAWIHAANKLSSSHI